MHEANRIEGGKKLLCLYVICAIDVAPETVCSRCPARGVEGGGGLSGLQQKKDHHS